MSVDVKTPTKAQFQHPGFPCGDKKSNSGSIATGGGPRPRTGSFYRQESHPGRIGRKRRYSERAGEPRQGSQFKRRFSGGRREKIVLPTKFLLGGNINDPLNLNSLCSNSALNQKTPVSSPLPLPAHRKHVEVLIPPNITDPLNLNSTEDLPVVFGNKKKRKHKYKRRSQTDDSLSEQINQILEQPAPFKDFTKPMTIEIVQDVDHGSDVVSDNPITPSSTKNKKNIMDKIVSPVIPQTSPKSRKRKRTSSGGEGSSNVPRALLREDSDKSTKSDKVSPYKPKYKRQQSNQSNQSHTHTQPQKQKPNKNKDKKFIYGNYNRYYGYRNPGAEDDFRLQGFQKEWFEGKDVLDIGCNVGHVTLAIAKNLKPSKIVGMDIDGQLIRAAKQNVRYYLSSQMTDTNKFPTSMAACYGPIAAPAVPDADRQSTFPNNFSFIQVRI